MPPHCDTLDGPVVQAARAAFEANNVNLILPYVPAESEHELKEGFLKASEVRRPGGKARELADYWFFELAVRLHRAGEGASYTGVKPAGLDEGPVVPRAERSMAKKDPTELLQFLQHTLEHVIHEKFERALATASYDVNDVAAAREHVQASLGLTLFSHGLYQYLTGGAPHEEGGGQQAAGGGHKH